MKNLITPTGLYIGGKWLQPGDVVPSDVADFDYEKAARKGMLKDAEGAEIRNAQASAAAELIPQTGRTFTEEEFGRVQRDRDSLNQSLNTAQQKLRELETQLTQARAAAADPADAAALAEYREVVGDLLPASFPSRKVLLDNGYYTLDSVRYADDETLKELSGIADGRLADIRKLAPFTVSED